MSVRSSEHTRQGNTRDAGVTDPVKVDRDLYEGEQFRALMAARNNLLAIWPASAYRDNSFEFRFLRQHYFVCNSPELVRHVFLEAARDTDQSTRP